MSWLANKSNDELLGYLNNEDGTGLSEAAKQELARRGALPGWSNEPANVAADLEASATPIAMEPEVGVPTDSARMAAERGRLRRAGLHPQTPVDPGTPEQQASWDKFLADNPDEMQRYRPQEFAAQQAASKAKEDVSLYDNIKRKYGESEAQAWLAARQQGQVYVPHFANQTSANENRRALEIDAAKGGAGSQASRALLNAADERYTDAVSRPRWAREAGLSQDAEATTNMSDGDLRLAAAQKRQADKQARDLQWRAMVMMRAGNYAGALALPGMDDAMRSSIMNQQNAALNANRPGGPINFGPTPLGVEAANAARQDPAGDARLKAIEAQMTIAAADREARAQEHAANMEDRRSEREERRAAMERESEQFFERMRTEREKWALDAQNQADSREREWGTRERMATDANDVQRQQTQAAAKAADEKSAKESADRRQLGELTYKQQSPGLYDIMTGRPDSQEASDALKDIAGRSDRFQYLPGGGFGEREATAMNDELLGLARQAELLGIKSPLADPAYRRDLIQRWGYSSGWSGGRGGWFGDFWQPMPSDLR
jgi:hypothetical protein